MSHDTYLPTGSLPPADIQHCTPAHTSQPELAFGDPLERLVRENAEQFRPCFGAWLAGNRHVWRAFEREADRIWNHGRRRYSARTIIEVLRHESALADNDPAYKLNDHNTPDLARLYVLAHPERVGFFERRVLSGSERAA